MKLCEFQGKRLFKEFGINVPNGRLYRKGEPFGGHGPCVLKAQVLSGGRGKAGGVVFCDEDAGPAALEKLFIAPLKGETVRAVLAEERIRLTREYYLAITFDGEARTPLILLSSAGGVEIERVAEENPEKILKLPFDALIGPCDFHMRFAARFLGTQRLKEFMDLLKNLYRLWRDRDAILAEINPLAETAEGFIALDAKVELDDDAKSRNAELFASLSREQAELGYDTEEEKRDTITYVPLDGDIGLISDGAGTGMLTLDLLRDYGGRAADFCEMGGLTSSEVMYSAMRRVAEGAKEGTRLKSLLIVLIGGFNRMDEMAEGIVRYVKEFAPSVPLVVRLCGTMEDEGRKIMRTAGLSVCDDLEEAVRLAVRG